MRRAYKYEVGLIRNELDNATDDFYSGKTSLSGYQKHKTDEEIEGEKEREKEGIEYWKKDKRDLTKMHKTGKPLEEILDWEDNWGWLEEKASYHLSQYEEYSDDLEPKKIRELLNRAVWSDDRIWQTLIEICDERIEHHKEQILALEKEKNRLRLQVVKKLGNIPSKAELDRLLRYEGAIERHLYKAMNQLERLQRMRSGDNVPAPVEVDVNTSQSG